MKLSSIKNAINKLKNSGVIAHATDTCYGFACGALNRRALVRLYKLKRMPHTKPISIMVADLKMAKRYGFFNKNAERAAKKYWPGAFTIIVKRKKTLPRFLNSGIKTIGIRVPNHKFSLELVKKFGLPLTTTSANISGMPSPYSVAEIKRQFRGSRLKPDLIIDSGKLKKNPPSTIVDFSGEEIKIIRSGPLNTKITQHI